MNGKLVAIILTVIFAVSVASAFFIPKETHEFFYIENVDVKVDKIGDDIVNLTFIVKIHRSDVLKNATLNLKVYDLKTGVLLEEKSVPVPEEGCRFINISMPFEKDRDYRVKVVLEKDGRSSQFTLNLRNLETLIPKDRELKVVLRDVDFKVLTTEDDRVNVLIRFYFDSFKDYDVRFHLKAVQNESNVLADEKWIDATLRSGKTQIVETNISVVEDYNYLIKLEAWRSGYMVKVWKAVLNLAPTKKVPLSVKEEEVKFEVEKFAEKYGGVKIPSETPPPIPLGVASERGVYKTPGFEALILIFAGGVAICLKRLGRL
ncbi:DUF7490 domain-containing protein [Archaeoglobus profundus]|uniref:DUF7490 domain-containing protein n=1 Tax=Archaeoglobus profundus (strain DSM 5631 / JCM 9629 / NBRC 100127 / Av18) TaxID=572546 RepID=D2RDD8_ARCPA|nr:hypothetical protein [Archaeoglobus profundus]ADB58132.1 conserved hypothetical protein [Archaeoglobus profundus DSM 5631]